MQQQPMPSRRNAPVLERIAGAQPDINLATAYLRSAELLCERQPDEPSVAMPASFLFSHAIELMLRSLLRLHGQAAKVAGTKGQHDILPLFKKCREVGIIPVGYERLRALIQGLDAAHSGYHFRYHRGSFDTIGLQTIRGEIRPLVELAKSAFDRAQDEARKEAAARGMVLISVPTSVTLSAEW